MLDRDFVGEVPRRSTVHVTLGAGVFALLVAFVGFLNLVKSGTPSALFFGIYAVPTVFGVAACFLAHRLSLKRRRIRAEIYHQIAEPWAEALQSLDLEKPWRRVHPAPDPEGLLQDHTLRRSYYRLRQYEYELLRSGDIADAYACALALRDLLREVREGEPRRGR